MKPLIYLVSALLAQTVSAKCVRGVFGAPDRGCKDKYALRADNTKKNSVDLVYTRVDQDGKQCHHRTISGAKAKCFHLDKTCGCNKVGPDYVQVYNAVWYTEKDKPLTSGKAVLCVSAELVTYNDCKDPSFATRTCMSCCSSPGGNNPEIFWNQAHDVIKCSKGSQKCKGACGNTIQGQICEGTFVKSCPKSLLADRPYSDSFNGAQDD